MMQCFLLNMSSKAAQAKYGAKLAIKINRKSTQAWMDDRFGKFYRGLYSTN